MSCSYFAQRLKFRNGERISVLKHRQTGLPVHQAVLFIDAYRRKGRAANTIHGIVRSLALFHHELDGAPGDVWCRLQRGESLTVAEVNRLAGAAQRRLDWEDVDVTDIQPATKVVSFERLRMRHKAPKQTKPVSASVQANRLRHFAKYLQFQSDYVAHGLPKSQAEDLQRASARAALALRSYLPSNGKRTVLSARQGLGIEEQGEVISVVHKDSPRNPWVRPFVRLRNHAAVALLFASGMREGEALNLKLADLVLGRNTIRILRRADDPEDARIHQPTPKTSDREIELTRGLSQLLSEYIKARGRIKAARRIPQLFVSEDGDALSASSVDKMFAKLRKACPELSVHLTCHITRHSWNERFSEVSEEMGLTEVEEERSRKAQQGWTEGSTMAATYTNRFTQRKGRAVSLKLQELLEGQLNQPPQDSPDEKD